MANKHNPDQAMAGMLKRKGVWPAATGGDCPDAATLAAYFERSLTAAETSQWELHFSSCSRCQEQLAALTRSERPTRTQSAEDKKSALPWLWNWRFLAPAGAVAVLVLAVVISQQMMRAPAIPTGGELMAKREATSAAPSAAPAQNSAQPTAEKDLEKGRVAANESLARRAGASEEQTRKKPSLSGKRPTKSSNVLDEANRVDMPARPAAGGSQVAAAISQVAPAAPSSGVAARGESAKFKERASEADRAQIQAVPAPQQVVTVEGIQQQERAAKIAEQKVAADRAAPMLQLKPGATADKQEGADRKRASAGAGYGVSGGVTGSMMAGRLMAPGEFIVATPNPRVLWRFGSSGLIERSRDAGKTWERQKSPVQEAFLAGSAPSDKVCWVGGKNGILLRTTDGGDHWEAIPSPTQSDVVLVKALNQFRVTVTDSDGHTYETPDAGLLWRTP